VHENSDNGYYSDGNIGPSFDAIDAEDQPNNTNGKGSPGDPPLIGMIRKLWMELSRWVWTDHRGM